MYHNCLAAAILVALGAPAGAASWADQMFQEVSKDFGSVPRGPALQHSFVFRNQTGETVRIAAIRVSCGCVTATAPRSVLAPGEEGAILATMDTTRFHGVKSVTVYVQFDQPKSEEVRLWLRANARDDVVLTPDTLAFGHIRRGASPTATVRVVFPGNGQIRLTEVQAESNYIQPSAREVSRQPTETSYEVTARLRPDAPTGKWFTDVWLQTDNSALPRVRVPLTVEIESPLTISPSVLALGDVKAGTEAERRVILRGIKPFRVVAVRGIDEILDVKTSADTSKAVHVLTVKLKVPTPGDFARRVEIFTDLDGGNSIDLQTQARVVP